MIQLIPSIDIIGGKCVRLTRGDYATKKEYGDAAEMARLFMSKGLTRLHVVDLDGARGEHIVNEEALRAVCRTGMVVDFGGGIKSDADIETAFACGAETVTVGSVAVTRRDMFLSWLQRYGAKRIILAADTENGMVRVNGWEKGTGLQLIPFLEQYVAMGVTTVLCTDISKDGMLAGPNLELYSEIRRRFPTLFLIASGGVASVDDIKALDDIDVSAVVIGKAIYEGTISLAQIAEMSAYVIQDISSEPEFYSWPPETTCNTDGDEDTDDSDELEEHRRD